MIKKFKKQKLTKKQLEIMKILWNSPTPMIASDIEKNNPSLNINTIQACLRALMKAEYIKVADIVYSGTVLTRSYTPCVSKEEYFSESFRDIVGSSPFALFASLIDAETDAEELEQLEQLIAKKKEELKKEQ